MKMIKKILNKINNKISDGLEYLMDKDNWMLKTLGIYFYLIYIFSVFILGMSYSLFKVFYIRVTLILISIYLFGYLLRPYVMECIEFLRNI